MEENDPNQNRSAKLREKFKILWLAKKNFIEKGRMLPVS
jgi:hypothetical protein